LTFHIPTQLSPADEALSAKITKAFNQVMEGFQPEICIIALAAATGMLIENNATSEQHANKLVDDFVSSLIVALSASDEDEAAP
jgi:hypothetical protein